MQNNNTVKLSDLMAIEKVLLTIKEELFLSLSLNDVLKLEKYIEEIGKITSTYFNLCSKFKDTHKNTDEIDIYCTKLLYENVEYNTEEVVKFILSIRLSMEQ